MTVAMNARLAELDRQLLKLAKPILVLKHLNWPDAIETAFLDGWRTGRPMLPEVVLQIPNWTEPIAALDQFVRSCEGDDPILQYLRRTARS